MNESRGRYMYVGLLVKFPLALIKLNVVCVMCSLGGRSGC